MATRQILLILLITLANHLSAQTVCIPTYTKEYFSTANIEAHAVKALKDGSYLVAGKTNDAISSNYSPLLFKLDGPGNIIWATKFEGSGHSYITGVLELSNNNIVVYGTKAPNVIEEAKGWIALLSSAGSIIWSKEVSSEVDGSLKFKSVIELNNNELAGTFTINDSTEYGDPVVFRMDGNGGVVWAKHFDNGNDDSFNDLAYQNGILYAGGYYSDNTSKRTGIITQIQAVDGSVITSKNIFYNSSRFEEVIGLEVYNSIVSYGLKSYDLLPAISIDMIYTQESLQESVLFIRKCIVNSDNAHIKLKRTPDNGFILMRSYLTYNSVTLSKFNLYGKSIWSTSAGTSYMTQVSESLDITADGGALCAGVYKNYIAGFNQTTVTKTNSAGVNGDCFTRFGGNHEDTATLNRRAINIQNKDFLASVKVINNTWAMQGIVMQNSTQCEKDICSERTPLPPGCGKTFRIEYVSANSTLLRDVITTTDGGKMAIGESGIDGMVVKLGLNGDVVWAKNYGEFIHNMYFTRIIRSEDNNYFIFAINRWTLAHNVYGGSTIIKIDDGGNVLWAKNIQHQQYSDIVDVVKTPDNGFVMIVNDNYGTPPFFSYATRFDANANIIWSKELLHEAAAPVYKSVTCSRTAVYLAHDDYSQNVEHRVGIDKLDYQTGNLIWVKALVSAEGDYNHINRVFAINDTAYLFFNHFDPIDFSNPTYRTIMSTLAPDGTLIKSLTLDGHLTVLPKTYSYWDVSPPTVTLTASEEFVMTHRVHKGATKALNISKFKKDGTKVWSRDYDDMGLYSPHNIHPQGNGVIISGKIETASDLFTNSFIIKTDSAGLVESSAECAPVDAPFFTTPFSLRETFQFIDGIQTTPHTQIEPAQLISITENLYAAQKCHKVDMCGQVGFLQRGNGCSLTDTLVYYLMDAKNCDAVATWDFDPAYFKAVYKDAYSLHLLPLQKGVSNVKATIEGNCMLTEKIITASVLLSAQEMNLGKDSTICNNQQIILRGGSGYQSYLWQDQSTDSILVVSQPGEYRLTVTDNCGNSKRDTINVYDVSSVFKIDGNSLKCNDDKITLTATPNLTKYTWFPDVNINSAGNAATVTPSVNTIYYVTAEHPLYGCQLKDSVLIEVRQSTAIRLGNDTSLCAGANITFHAPGAFENYTWSNGTSNASITVSEPGIYWVAALQNGCYSRDTVQINNSKPLPGFSLGNDSTLCEGRTMTYNFNLPGASYLWNNGTNTNRLTVSDAGLYWLTVAQNGCSKRDSVNISSKPSPFVFLGNDTTLCEGEELVLNAFYNNSVYKWQDGSNQPVFTVQNAGLYFTTVSLNNCTASDSVRVQYKTEPRFTLGPDTTICIGIPFVLAPTINSDATYRWQDGSSLPTYTVVKEGVYTLETYNQCGSYKDEISIVPGLCKLMMPDAFTPNGDLLNDVFRVKYIFPATQFVFTIYNRWGQKVFETTDIRTGWDGNFRGQTEPSGVYTWTISYADLNGKKEQAFGSLTLLR